MRLRVNPRRPWASPHEAGLTCPVDHWGSISTFLGIPGPDVLGWYMLLGPQQPLVTGMSDPSCLYQPLPPWTAMGSVYIPTCKCTPRIYICRCIPSYAHRNTHPQVHSPCRYMLSMYTCLCLPSNRFTLSMGSYHVEVQVQGL